MATEVQIRDAVDRTRQARVDGYGAVRTSIHGTAGNRWNINSDGQAHVVMSGTLSSENSTNVPLATGATFTGSATELFDYAMINVSVKSDTVSATDGLKLEQSCDGINWDVDDVFTIPASAGKTFSVQSACKYFRTRYVNGGTAQSYMRLNTVLKKNMTKPSSHRIQDAIIDDDDAELAKAVLTGKDPASVYRNVNVTEDGYLAISDNSDGLSIAEGNVTGKTFLHKFGNAPDFDTGDGFVTVWDGAEDATNWEQMVYQYSSTADIDSISSSETADSQEVVIEGLDANWEEVSQTATLNGQNRVALSTPMRRCFRAYNDNSTNLAGHVIVSVNGTLSGGVPTNSAKIRAIIDPNNQQTEMAVYTIPAGKTGYLRDWYASTSGASRNSNYVIKLFSRLLGKIFRLKHTSAIADTGTSAYRHQYVEPEVFPEKTDIEIRANVTAGGVSEAAVSAGFDIVLVDD
jgi:hypothetical protein